MNRLLLILLIITTHVIAQKRDTLQGRVTVEGINAPNIFVINKSTGAEAKSGTQGLFKIAAKNGDRLTVYSDKTVVKEFYISTESFKNPPYELAVLPQSYEIEEVVVSQIISPEALGLPKKQLKRTVAERRVYTAAGDKPLWVYALGLLGGSMPVDPFINAITGRTKMLKKELEAERRQTDIAAIDGVFTAEEMLTMLHIPAEKVQAFLFYAVEDSAIREVIKEGNNERTRLELFILAQKYLTLQEQEDAADLPPPSQPPTDED